MRSWPDLLWQPIGSRTERDLIEANASALSQPASGQWLMARVAALLMDYYAADVPASIVSMAAEDWADELAEFPQWAVTDAVRWWKGESNPDRRKKPMPGDIAARARLAMGPVIVARLAVTRFDNGKKPWQPTEAPPRKPQDAAERQRIAAEVLAAASFTPKRMDAAE
jgi:hypothetical protein